MRREAGVLLSVTSLPSKYGIGCFDRAAKKRGRLTGRSCHWGLRDIPMQRILPTRHILPLMATPILSAWMHW